jgi:putative FmdB family regulatory protein
MPLYEYECTACHRRTERIQKFSDPEITICPHCEGELKRVITAPAFAMKGGGWYADGYASAKPSGNAATSSDTPAAPAAAPAAAAPSPAPAAASSSDKK